MAGLTAPFAPEAGHDGKAPMSVTLRWPPKAALEGRRPGPFILRGSLRSHLRMTDSRLRLSYTCLPTSRSTHGPDQANYGAVSEHREISAVSARGRGRRDFISASRR